MGSQDEKILSQRRKARPTPYKGTQATQPARSVPSPVTRYVAPPRARYNDLGDLMASGDLRSLVVKGDGDGGGTFTLKAVLEVPEGALGVYMYGEVASVEILPSLIDDLLRKGEWRWDKYFAASERERLNDSAPHR